MLVARGLILVVAALFMKELWLGISTSPITPVITASSTAISVGLVVVASVTSFCLFFGSY